MGIYIMTEKELKFADIIWENEPLGSGRLVKLCKHSLNWEKSTTYTILKKLCVQEIFENKNAVVTSLIKRDEYHQLKSEKLIDENFDGSLPKFLAAFISKRNLSKKQVEEIKKMINDYEEEV